MMFISGRASRRRRCPRGSWLHCGSASSGYKVSNDLWCVIIIMILNNKWCPLWWWLLWAWWLASLWIGFFQTQSASVWSVTYTKAWWTIIDVYHDDLDDYSWSSWFCWLHHFDRQVSCRDLCLEPEREKYWKGSLSLSWLCLSIKKSKEIMLLIIRKDEVPFHFHDDNMW